MSEKPISATDRMYRNEAAAYIGVAVQTLALWALTGRYSIPFIKIGRRVMYRREDLDRFLASRTFLNTSQAKAADRKLLHR